MADVASALIHSILAKFLDLTRPAGIAKAEFDAMLLDGTPCRSEGFWSSALHIIHQKENGWRPCGDYRALNHRTIPDRYPVQHIHDYSRQLFSSSVFYEIAVVRTYS
jgi:hypothetical protein